MNILGVLSPYTLADEQNAPAARWEIGGGTWAGVFDQHWSDLLCRAILRATSEFDLEVWQPDLRADRVYAHTFDDGLRHVLFPARRTSHRHKQFLIDPVGLEYPLLLRAVDQVGSGTVLHLNTFENPLTLEVLRRLPKTHGPVIVQQHGDSTFTTMARRGRNLLRRLYFLLKAAEQRRLSRHIDGMVAQTRSSGENLRRVFPGPISIMTMGVDFGYWQPGDRREARRHLGLPDDRYVLLTGSMLGPRKQVDKLIRVLVELDRAGHDFVYLVAGGGDPDYEAYLRVLARPLAARGKIRFLGHLTSAPLLCAYRAADLFLSTSSSEGGPVAVMKAFACQVPVFTTDVGHVAEFMHDQGAKVVVPNSPPVWLERLSRILKGEPVPAVSHEVARQTYDWAAVARRFVAIYQEACARHGLPAGAL